ncbi:hypothetical protein X566_20035 [Afipia sp. P52-10]|uniref:hypothetical protein n=1 Tax=Afipia sp. P52-10 TaxID=1429916 RepID=UPI0003DF48A7|nr:hypothetical protein [Afipia sp. P52-10]ETR75904.1 hypothetical protein X566_20035 [Afipia sp. P52-10]
MILVPHRTTPNRRREQLERVHALVREQLQGKRICNRCGATFSSYADKCEASLDEMCPGARAIADATADARKLVGLK